MRSVLLVAVMALAGGCTTVCPSGTDPRADPEGRECGSHGDCVVRCACAMGGEDGDDEIEVIAGECQGGICLGAEEVCEDGCGSMELVAYCRVPE